LIDREEIFQLNNLEKCCELDLPQSGSGAKGGGGVRFGRGH
jgi:hypothetical protein